MPIIASISRDLFLAVPRDLQDGASALGATRWEVVRGVVLPSTASGVVAASLLGLGRALGEAIAVAQVIGAGSEIQASLFKTGDTLAARIANQFPGALTEMHKASLFYLGVILLVIGLALEPGRAVDRPPLRLPGSDGAMSEADVRPDRAADPERQPAPAPGSSAGSPSTARPPRRVLAVAVLAIVIYTVVSRGASALSLDFLVTGAPDGIGPALRRHRRDRRASRP